MLVRLLATAAIAVSLGFSSRLVPAGGSAGGTIAPEAVSADAVVADPESDARALERFLRSVDVELAAREIALAETPPLSDDERQRLRHAPYHAHVHASAAIGIRLGRERDLRAVAPGSPYYVTGTDGLLAPAAIATLDRIGARFHAACRAAGVPPARFIVTSTYRSASDQADLREINANATHGRSSHEFGGSFDIAYERFLPAADSSAGATGLLQIDDRMPPRSLATWTAAAARREARWAIDIAAHHTRVYDALLGRVLLALDAEQATHTLREYRQTCYHVTARPLSRA